MPTTPRPIAGVSLSARAGQRERRAQGFAETGRSDAKPNETMEGGEEDKEKPKAQI